MLIPGICTQCGATLSVDKGKDAMVCPYCNTPFIVEKAIQNFSNVYNITAQNVYVQGDIEKEYEIKGGVLTKYNGNSLHIKIPQGVKKIGPKVFAGTMIETVELGDEVIEMYASAFYDCDHLKEIHFSPCIQTIQNASWDRHCRNLDSIYVSSSSLGKANYDFGHIKPDTNEFECSVTNLVNIYVDGEKLGSTDSRLKFFEMTPIGYPHYIKRIKEENEKKHQEVVEAWKSKNKCSYCGGEFSGILIKKCCRCRREKDY